MVQSTICYSLHRGATHLLLLPCCVCARVGDRCHLLTQPPELRCLPLCVLMDPDVCAAQFLIPRLVGWDEVLAVPDVGSSGSRGPM